MTMDALTVWTFQDAQGLMHPAVVVAQTELAGKRYSLAVSDKPGLIALEEKAGTMHVVTDKAVVARLGEALQSASSGSMPPAVMFEALGKDGKKQRFAGVRVLAHQGKSYLHALDTAGAEHVFLAQDAAHGGPVRVADKVLEARLMEQAHAAQEQANFRQATLTLPGGKTRDLLLVEDVRVGAKDYVLGLDQADKSKVYVLRVGKDGAFTPVTDTAELDLVRANMKG